MSSISVWRTTPPAASEYPALEEEISTDVVIIGGGITGVTLALNLAEQSVSAVLLEAHDLGCGSTGNSTGNLYETISRGISRIVNQWGEDVARAVTTARRQQSSRSSAGFSNMTFNAAFAVVHCAATRPPTTHKNMWKRNIRPA